VSRLLERLGVELPVVQAGMGGGISRHELAAAVSEAGGLGTIGHLEPDAMAAELAAARRRTTRPVAINVLLPFARRRHWAVAEGAYAAVTFWGRPRRRTGGTWLHQCGSVEEARAARSAGADGVVVQGAEAGGHVRGEAPALELLAAARAELPDGYPVLLAGGIATGGDVREALDAGADAAVAGTRFLLSDESRAHAGYKQRLRESGETLVTELFGVGWAAAPHRVVPNEATERWLSRDRRGPRLLRAMNRVTGPLVAVLPPGPQATALRHARPGRPFLSPAPPTDDGPEVLLDAGPLYAGETVARIHDVRPAGDLVRELARS
jgi:NAD(P)H-dependent flavin oxidoreductase YrpB (nitropropane dioxygenase family)